MSSDQHKSEDLLEGQVPGLPREKRFRWTKRILLGLLILVVGLVALWFWWNAQGDREIREEIARYRAAGQPFDPADFEPPPVDDEDNAALALKNAVAVMRLNATQQRLIDEIDAELVSEKIDALREIVKANAEAFKLVRQARSMSGVDWGIRMRRPLIAVPLPNYSSQRDLTRLLGAAALYHHERGDDAEAIETLRDALAAGETLSKSPLLISYLVRLATDALVWGKIEEITHDLRVSADGGPRGGPLAAARLEQVKALIGELLEEEELKKDFQTAFYFERSSIFDTVQGMLSGEYDPAALLGISPPGRSTGILSRAAIGTLKPLLKKDLLDILRVCSAYADAAAESNYPAAEAELPQLPEADSPVDRVRHMFSRMLLPSFGRVYVLHFRALAMRRMAAVALAIRLYELDHGKRPEKLTELVPKYLPAVPQDPFADDGRPIGYLPHAPRPLLYSVGLNGIDQGGKYAESPDQPPDWENFDIPFFLNGDRPRRVTPQRGSPPAKVPSNEQNEEQPR